MKLVSYLIVLLFPLLSFAQNKPAYCDELPSTYEKGATASRPSLPKFSTTPVTEYKVQVAILKFTNPKDYPFHESLIARYRPCEEVWVVESKQSFKNKSEALQLRDKLKKLGYDGAYLIEMVAWE